jgi:hypothetical protein
MKIYLRNQNDKLDAHLKDLIPSKVSYFNKGKLKEKISTIEIVGKRSFDDIDISFLYSYQIFPGSVMSFKTQWELENRKLAIGDTIAQQVFIPPVNSCSLKIIFGVRIKNVIYEPDKKGFSYQTLEGHVEKGESIFTIERNGNEILFKITTYSKPGQFISKLVAPVFSIPYQAYCTRKALENVKRQIELQK